MSKDLSETVQDDKIPPPLDSIRLGWLFDAAQEHFVSKIADLETENLRHQALLDEPYSTNSIVQGKTREQRIASNKEFLTHYRKIVQFCMIVRERLMEVSAEEFAEGLRPILKAWKNADKERQQKQ